MKNILLRIKKEILYEEKLNCCSDECDKCDSCDSDCDKNCDTCSDQYFDKY